MAAPGFPRRIHPPALAQFLTFGFVPEQRCAVADLFELPAGHRLEIDIRSGRTRLVRWFVHEDIEAEKGPSDIWIDRTRQAVDSAVSSRVWK